MGLSIRVTKLPYLSDAHLNIFNPLHYKNYMRNFIRTILLAEFYRYFCSKGQSSHCKINIFNDISVLPLLAENRKGKKYIKHKEKKS